MATDCQVEFTLWKVGPQEVHVDFAGGQIVSDAGLLALRDFDKKIGFVAGLAEHWPDPRAQANVEHSAEALLTQQIYQILGGYADWNDAQALRDDPLFRTLVGVSPDDERPLASGVHERSPASARQHCGHAFKTEAVLGERERVRAGVELRSVVDQRLDGVRVVFSSGPH